MKIWRSNICNIEEGKDCAYRVQGAADAAPHEGLALIGFTQLSLNVISLAASQRIYTILQPPQATPQKVQFKPQFEPVLVHASQPELGAGTGPKNQNRTEPKVRFSSVSSSSLTQNWTELRSP